MHHLHLRAVKAELPHEVPHRTPHRHSFTEATPNALDTELVLRGEQGGEARTFPLPDGRFAFHDVPAGKHYLEVNLVGLVYSTVELTVDAAGEVSSLFSDVINVSLQASWGSYLLVSLGIMGNAPDEVPRRSPVPSPGMCLDEECSSIASTSHKHLHPPPTNHHRNRSRGLSYPIPLYCVPLGGWSSFR